MQWIIKCENSSQCIIVIIKYDISRSVECWYLDRKCPFMFNWTLILKVKVVQSTCLFTCWLIYWYNKLYILGKFRWISKIFYESKLKRLKHYFSSILIKLYHCVQCWQQLLYLLHHIAETYISLSFSRIIHFKFTSRENGFSIQFFFYSKL